MSRTVEMIQYESYSSSFTGVVVYLPAMSFSGQRAKKLVKVRLV